MTILNRCSSLALDRLMVRGGIIGREYNRYYGQETNSSSTYAERIAEVSPGPLCPWRGVDPRQFHNIPE